MVVWSGLRIILEQTIVDVLALVGFGFAVLAKPSMGNGLVLVVTSILTVVLSGNLTNRWTIIFPMVPLIVLQGLRRIFIKKWILWTIGSLSVFLIVVAAILSLLFPAVELPPVYHAKYNVGVADVFLPVNLESINSDVTNATCAARDHVTVRILYPTLDKPGSIPYLRPQTAKVFCEETMKFGAPPPLQSFGWMLHTWRLAQLPARWHASPIEGPSPIIVFSHGLGANAEIYSYQTLALAARGYVVVVVEHTDGTAPVVMRKDGSILKRDQTIYEVKSSTRLRRSILLITAAWLMK